MPAMMPDLPHGPGFQLVSEVVALEPGTNTVHCRLNLEALNRLDNADHFPDKRRMPTVLQIETARQTLLGLPSLFPETKGLWPQIVRLREVKSSGRISATTVICRSILFSFNDGHAATFSCMAGDRVATEGTMEFKLVDKDGSADGFQLVHRHTGVDTANGIVIAEYDYTGEEVFDLTGLKYLPETLALEAMAQAAIQIRLGNDRLANKLFWFVGIESAEFLEPIPRLGQLDLLATVIFEERSGKTNCQAIQTGKIMARATISFAMTRAPAAKT